MIRNFSASFVRGWRALPPHRFRWPHSGDCDNRVVQGQMHFCRNVTDSELSFLFCSRRMSLLLGLVAPIQFLLQHNAVNARLEQCEDQARLALEIAQAVEDLGRRLGRHAIEDRS